MTNQTDLNVAETVETEATDLHEDVNTMIEILRTDKKLTMKDIADKLNEVINKVNEMDVSRPQGDTVRDIKSDRAMNEDDARRVLLGDLKDTSTKEAALELGLSYGQIYSCRKGFTFKKVYKEFREANAEE